MKHKLFAFALCVLALLFPLGTVGAAAESQENTVDVQQLLDGILDFQLRESGETSVQNWLDGGLKEDIGDVGEWYVLGLSQLGGYDTAAYREALEAFLKDREEHSASSKLKYALTLSACGSTSAYISETINRSVGKQGIMSFVFGLHLFNNGYQSRELTGEECLSRLLSLQCRDGGWSVMGETGDADVTAMTLQALAVYNRPNSGTADEKVTEAVEKGVNFLSAIQQESGGYLAYGGENAESTAQVILALSSLNIDAGQDARFQKNGNSPLDALLTYRLADGSFCHHSGEGFNKTATVQAFDACVGYLRMQNRKGPFYLLDNSRAEDVMPEEPSQSGEDGTAEETAPLPEGEAPHREDSLNPAHSETVRIRLWISLAIAAVALLSCLILYGLKKRHWSNFVCVLAVAALLLAAVFLLDIRSADDYYGDAAETKEHPIGTVTLTVRCDTVAGKTDSAHIPKDGVILKQVSFQIEEGDTVYDILMEASKAYRIQVDNRGSKNGAYIAGIQQLYEFDFGDLSGWVYHVNGTAPSVGCDGYRLSDGDKIEWLYTCDLGNDVR